MTVRGASATLRLAGARLRTRPGTVLLALLGVAAGAAVVVGVLAGSAVARERSIGQAVDRIPAESRAVRAVWFGVPGTGERYASLDARVRAAARGLDLDEPVRLALFRESTVAGRFVGLAALDGVGRAVVVRSGRLPRACRPARCEVLRLRGAGRLPDAPGLRLVEVGTAVLRSQQLFGDFLAPTDNALADAAVAPALRRAAGYHRPPPGPLVVAEGVEGLTASPELARTYRSDAWVWPLGDGRPREREIDGLASSVDRLSTELRSASDGFAVTAPLGELRAAEEDARVAGRRLLLVGGQAAALLLAFAVLAAAGLRRDLHAARERLTLNGAGRAHRALLTVAETGAVSVGGVALGLVVGAAAGAVAAHAAGVAAADVLRESLAGGAGLLVLALTAAAATAVLALATSAPGRGRGLEGLALAALAVAAVALLAGVGDRDRLARSDGAAALLLVLPGLLAFAAAVVAARVVAPAARLAARATRRGVSARLALTSLGRGAGAGVVAAAFLAVSVSLALVAETYRETLRAAERDAAAARVPLDLLVREDLRKLVPVQDAAPLGAFAGVAPGADAVPVLRQTASAGRLEGITGVTLLGLPPDALPRLRRWRDDERGAPAVELAARIAAPATGEPGGVRIPAGARGLAALVSGDEVVLSAELLTPRGRALSLPLGRTGGARALAVRVPAEARGGLLVALELAPPGRLQERGADAGVALERRVRVETVELDGAAAGLTGWRGSAGVDVRPAGEGLAVEAALTPQRLARVRAPQPTDAAPPAVLVTPRLAAAAGPSGLLPLSAGGAEIAVRVAGLVDRVPGARGEAVLGDRDALVAALTAERPGSGRVNEVWLAVPDEQARAAERALARPPFRALETVSRRALEAEARQDPLAHGTLLTLAVAAIVALALAVAGLALAVLSDLRDDRGELAELEAEGATPALLRRVVRLRAAAVAAVGAVGGLVAGLALAALVTDLVAVTSRGGVPEVPLALVLDGRVVGAAALAVGALAALAVGFATRRAFRGEPA